MRIRRLQLDGLDALEVLTRKARMVIVTAIGPRIAHFGTAAGRNLLYWDPAARLQRGPWVLRGGHRIWATRPLADEAEDAYAEDNGPCEVEADRDRVVVTGAEHPVYRIRRGITVQALSEDTFTVEGRVANSGDMLWSGGVWALTCTLPRRGTTYGVPLGQPGPWDVFTLVVPRRWGGGHTSRVADPQLRLTEHCLVVRPAGRECKRMIEAPRGVIGMTDDAEGISFLKRVPYVEGANYPLHTNIAFYVAPKNFMVEMETMGPDVRVVPGAATAHTETWALRPPVDWAALDGSEDFDL